MLDVVEYPRLSVAVIDMGTDTFDVLVDGIEMFAPEEYVLPLTEYDVVLIVALYFADGVPDMVIFDLP